MDGQAQSAEVDNQLRIVDPKKPEDEEINIVDAKSDVTTANSISFKQSFTITWKNPETGVIKVGTFTATRPGLGALGRIAVLKAKLNGGMVVDPNADFIHAMVSDLHYILTDFPDWWKPDEFFTANPLRKVWDHVVAWLNTFRSGNAG